MKRGPGVHIFRHAHWMLLGLVLCLALSFWLAGLKFGKKIEDTYHDARRLQALQTFEQAIVLGETDTTIDEDSLRTKFPCADSKALARLEGQLQILKVRLNQLGQDNDKQLHMDFAHWPPPEANCKDLLEATAWLIQGRRLETTLTWPGLLKDHSDTVMTVPETVFLQDNPWRGADGCVYLGPDSQGRLLYLREQRTHEDTCPAMAPSGFKENQILGIARPKGDKDQRYSLSDNDPAWAIPEDLGVILSDLNRIRRPEGAIYEDYTQIPDNANAQSADPNRPQPHGPNKRQFGKRTINLGFSVYLTLVPSTQALVQKWSRCYAGDRNACEVVGLDRQESTARIAKEMYESAAVRMAAVAVLDVGTGRIEAIGSAHTDCYEQDHDGPGHVGSCPDAPFRPRYDPDRLLNHAVFVDALPASTIKPIEALGFLMDNPAYRSGQPLSQLHDDLKHSRTANFLDRLFCGRELTNGQNPWQWRDCQRPRRVQEAAAMLGWNLQCSEDAYSRDCAGLDVLFGRPAGLRLVSGVHRQPMGLALLYGRLFVEPVGANPEDTGEEAAEEDDEEPESGVRLMNNFRFDEGFARSCSQGQGAGRWQRCRGAGGLIANEGWGQGNARATTVGVAGMLARLAAAANGIRELPYPHLLDHIGDANGQIFHVPQEHLAAATPVTADPELAKLVLSGMTSHTRGGTADNACASVFGGLTCDSLDWIAGKTGTPPFRFDDDQLVRIQAVCAPDKARARGETCNVLPYKWYVAAFKTEAGKTAPYDKVIAVLTERNWRKSGQKKGLVQAPGDQETNLSAELAFRVIKSMHKNQTARTAAAGSGRSTQP